MRIKVLTSDYNKKYLLRFYVLQEQALETNHFNHFTLEINAPQNIMLNKS
jgi:hypothetical protein